MTTNDNVPAAQPASQRPMDRASVAKAYGEPITAEGRTIIPVAVVIQGGPRGSGRGSRSGAAQPTDSESNDHSTPRRGGGPGRTVVRPVGFIDITASGTQFVPIGPNQVGPGGGPGQFGGPGRFEVGRFGLRQFGRPGRFGGPGLLGLALAFVLGGLLGGGRRNQNG